MRFNNELAMRFLNPFSIKMRVGLVVEQFVFYSVRVLRIITIC